MNTMRRVAELVSGSILLLSLARGVAGQESLAAAKNLYASAAYEEALTVLDRLKTTSATPQADAQLVEQYRAFCLLALGRQAEADQALAAMVTADPGYRPDETDLSPRLAAAFHAARRRILPTVVQQRYEQARATYERKEYAAAAAQFARVLALLRDPDLEVAGGDPSLGRLQTTAAGFLDLARAAASPPPAQPAPSTPPSTPAPPSPGPSATFAAAAPTPPVQVQPAPSPQAPAPTLAPAPPTAAAPPAPARLYDANSTEVTPPVAIREELPPFPFSRVAAQALRQGVIQVVIGEDGQVESAVIRESIGASYDPLLLRAARSWRYKPATKDGRPVRYVKAIRIVPERQ